MAKGLYRVLTSYQDNWLSHERNAVVEIDEAKITPGENLKKLTPNEIKAWQKMSDAQAAEERGDPAYIDHHGHQHEEGQA